MGKTESVFLLLLASLMTWLIAVVRSRQPEYPGIPPFLDTGVDEVIGEQECCKPLGDDGPEGFPLTSNSDI